MKDADILLENNTVAGSVAAPQEMTNHYGKFLLLART